MGKRDNTYPEVLRLPYGQRVIITNICAAYSVPYQFVQMNLTQSNMAAASLDGGPLLRFGTPAAAPGDLSVEAAPVRVNFVAPSVGTSGVADYHAAMSLDPFADHVGSSLVSSTVVSDAASAAPSANVVLPPK